MAAASFDGLLAALEAEDWNAFAELLRAHPELATARAGDLGRTALHHAAHAGALPAVELLLAAGAQVDAVYRHVRYTPLCEATRAGHLAVVEALLAAGANPRVHTGILPVASLAATPDILERLCAAGANVAAPVGDASLLDNAVSRKSPAHARVLLKWGAKPNSGMRAAVRDGQAEILDLLLEAGGRVQSKDLTVAADRGHAQVVRSLLRAGLAGDASLVEEAIRLAARNAHHDVLAVLIEHGGLPRSAALRIALLAAAANKQLTLIERWFEDARAADEAAFATTLQEVFWTGISATDVAVTRWALRHGATPNMTTDTMPPIALLAYRCDPAGLELMALCFEHGADPNLHRYEEPYDESPGTALEWAAAQGFEAAVALLLAQPGIAIDLPAGVRDQFTPLMHAASRGQLGVVRQLLDAGASIDMVVRRRRGPHEGRLASAYSLALERGRQHVCALLRERGADPELGARSVPAEAPPSPQRGRSTGEPARKSRARRAQPFDYAAALERWAEEHDIGASRDAFAALHGKSLSEVLAAIMPKGSVFSYEPKWGTSEEAMARSLFLGYAALATDFKPTRVSAEWSEDDAQITISFHWRREQHRLVIEHDGGSSTPADFLETLNDFAAEHLDGEWVCCSDGEWHYGLYLDGDAADDLRKLNARWLERATGS